MELGGSLEVISQDAFASEYRRSFWELFLKLFYKILSYNYFFRTTQNFLKSYDNLEILSL